jgi:hypothetical protein
MPWPPKGQWSCTLVLLSPVSDAGVGAGLQHDTGGRKAPKIAAHTSESAVDEECPEGPYLCPPPQCFLSHTQACQTPAPEARSAVSLLIKSQQEEQAKQAKQANSSSAGAEAMPPGQWVTPPAEIPY